MSLWIVWLSVVLSMSVGVSAYLTYITRVLGAQATMAAAELHRQSDQEIGQRASSRPMNITVNIPHE